MPRIYYTALKNKNLLLKLLNNRFFTFISIHMFFLQSQYIFLYPLIDEIILLTSSKNNLDSKQVFPINPNQINTSIIFSCFIFINHKIQDFIDVHSITFHFNDHNSFESLEQAPCLLNY